jgi:hypothetical protein
MTVILDRLGIEVKREESTEDGVKEEEYTVLGIRYW